jgi:pyruvate/2-oxoglutarate dehydrogenase complex dihydrolipoamide acyltransferase (E2) component
MSTHVATDVAMPIVTEAGEDAVITAWFVDEGQACQPDQLIAEVQAEKIAVEVFAPIGGYVVNRVAIGDPVAQDSTICQIVASLEPSTEPVQTTEVAVEQGPAVKASPAAKRLGRELGVDLATIAGSGPGGRITENDVRGQAGSAPGFQGLRSVIARNMRQSHTETAPVTLFTTADFGPERPTTISASVVKAAAVVLTDHPELNGSRTGDDFTPAADVNVAVAVQTDDGLVAPVIANADSLTIGELADRIQDLAQRARTKALTTADYQGGTFTVTNLGGLGIDGFTPIINLPQVAILGVGAMRKVPAFAANGSVVASHQMVLSLTFDHAFVDGAPAARFLEDLVAALTNPPATQD